MQDHPLGFQKPLLVGVDVGIVQSRFLGGSTSIHRVSHLRHQGNETRRRLLSWGIVYRSVGFLNGGAKRISSIHSRQEETMVETRLISPQRIGQKCELLYHLNGPNQKVEVQELRERAGSNAPCERRNAWAHWVRSIH